MTARDPDRLPEGGTAQATAGLFEGLLRDWVTNGAVLLSLILVVAGLVDGTSPWPVVGTLAGVLGMVVSFATIARKSPPGRAWLVVTTVLVVDAAMLAAIWLG